MRPDRLATISGIFAGGGVCIGCIHVSGRRISCDDVWAGADEVQAQSNTSTAELSRAASRIVLVRRLFIAMEDSLSESWTETSCGVLPAPRTVRQRRNHRLIS